MSKQSKRRKLAKLRACLCDGQPLFLMPSAMQQLEQLFSLGGDIEQALSFGREVESITKFINGVAVIPVTGVLRDEVDWMVRFGYASSYQLIEREFIKAIENPQVKGVIFYFDSPGGSAIGCKRVADTVFNLRGEKPIRGFCQGVCGSAAFYILAACDSSEATADSLVGSVGTIYPHLEFAKMLKEDGVGATVFTNSDSPKKGHGHQFQELSGEAKKTLQDFVDSYGESFIADVAKYRGLAVSEVVERFGQGDAFRADLAVGRGMIDSVVSGFTETLKAISGESDETPVTETDSDETPVLTGSVSAALAAEVFSTPVLTGSFFSMESREMKVSKKIRAQLFALDLIDDPNCSDEICTFALRAWFARSGAAVPEDELAVLNGLRVVNEAPAAAAASEAAPAAVPAAEKEEPATNVAAAHQAEMHEARLADLQASAALHNQALGHEAVTAKMILDSVIAKHSPAEAVAAWSAAIAEAEAALPTARVRVIGEGHERYAADVVDALVYRASDNPGMELSDNAAALTNRPLWLVAAECLQMAGEKDVELSNAWSQREAYAERAMQMGQPGQRHVFHSANEDRRYVQAAGTPAARPGDFPNILSGLMNKYLDTVQLDDDYSYPEVSALLPSGLNDFKPGTMVNKGIVEELDELRDAEQFKELGVQEEVLSHVFLRRFGNKWGWTPVLVANDDMNAFAEGMLGLQEAWQVTQNRLVIDRFTSTENLLDGAALFANRTDVGSATNNNIAGGGTPSDAEWALMETGYADIGGINTARRVRGTLNTWFGPTGLAWQNARRTFMTLNLLEPKSAATTANIGLYRGQVRLVPESELRTASALIYYGLRSPTRLNTATVVRGYFNGFGTAGRRERWYDPTDKTTWVSIEGRIAVAVKNWRFAIRNPGA